MWRTKLLYALHYLNWTGTAFSQIIFFPMCMIKNGNPMFLIIAQSPWELDYSIAHSPVEILRRTSIFSSGFKSDLVFYFDICLTPSVANFINLQGNIIYRCDCEKIWTCLIQFSAFCSLFEAFDEHHRLATFRCFVLFSRICDEQWVVEDSQDRSYM